MNLITNSCLGGFMYRYTNERFNNPFIWCNITIDDFIKLAESYDSFDFKNISAKIDNALTISNVKDVFIDVGGIVIEFPHYRYEKDSETVKRYIDVYSDNILEYATQKWFNRLDRMVDAPIFIFHDSLNLPTPIQRVKDFLNLDIRYDKYVVTKYKDRYDELKLEFPNNDNILFVNYSKRLEDVPYQIAKKINIHKNDDIRRVIWQFWTGPNPITDNRKKCIQLSGNNFGVPVKLLQGDEILKWQVPEHPFHPAYQYLSYTQRSDYLRCYFLHFYGGGYADIKEYSKDNNWKECFDIMDANKDIWVIGQHEILGGSAYREYNTIEGIEHLVANGYFIMRPQTEFTQRWFDWCTGKMDVAYEPLKKCWEITKNNPRIRGQLDSRYPLRWAALTGEIAHRLEWEYRGNGRILNVLKSGRTNMEYK